jgi:CBS domain-containing protein
MNIGEICHRDVITVRASDDLTSAAELMRTEHVGYLVVVEPEVGESTVRPIGVLSDRDIVIAVVARGVDVRSLRVGDVMTQQPITVEENYALKTALQEMRRIGVRRMPVVGHRGQLVGLVSLDDVLAELAGEFQDVASSIANEQRIEGALRS